MATDISSKNELSNLSADLSTKIKDLQSDMEMMNSSLNSAKNYDGIDVESAANKIKTNIANVVKDLLTASANINGYSNALAEFDIDDFEEFDNVVLNYSATAENNAATTLDNKDDSETNNNSKNSDATVTLSTPAATAAATATNAAATKSQASNTSTYYSNSVSGANSKKWSTGGNNSNSSGSSGSSTSNNSTTSNGGNKPNYDDSTSNWNPSAKVGDSRDITTPLIVTPTGQTSSNGRTQRSAASKVTIKQGDPNDPNIDITKYHNNVAEGFKVTTGNLAYELCDEDVELLCAIVSAESDKSYDDALAVTSTILNRCETSNWINAHGRDPIAQVTAPNQYVVYQHGSYERYMDGNAPEAVVQAVKDALAGVRNHEYTSFRSNSSTSYSDNMITSTGNRYK